jgi:hypothetical protein
MTKTFLLILILLLAFIMAFIPHIGYAYPLRQAGLSDEEFTRLL